MKIVLVNPPSPYLENDASYPPMGLMYIAAAVEKMGHTVQILDLTLHQAWENVLSNYFWDTVHLIGITCVTPNVPLVKKIVNILPEKIPKMIGGAHPTFLPLDSLEQTGCDFVFRGEAELTIHKVISDVKQQSLNRIYQGKLVPVNLIPKPARHLVDLYRYSPGGEVATPVYTSRGCPFRCHFCSKLIGNKYREIPITRIIEEINDVIEIGIKKIVFGDDNIASNPRRLKNLLNAVKSLEINFRLNQDARHNSRDLFELAYHCGCTDISFGIESGSQQILDAMNKQITVEKNYEAIKMTQESGMEAKAYFMVNFPGETEETVKETLKFADKARPDKWLLSAFAPLPGSFVYDHPEKFGITSMSENWGDFYLVGKNGKFNPCFTTNYLSYQKQIDLHKMMYNGLKEILG
jgi:anaerobic magnesium-protoporphyrin IX monomethyl ester cyclase